MDMPELPEVEVIRRGLSRPVGGAVGAAHFKIEFLSETAKPLRDAIDLIKEIPKAGPLEKIDRNGKYLILNFERLRIAVHFGMTGQLYITTTLPNSKDVDPHIHLVLEFPLPVLRQQAWLVYRDPRKFGWWGDPDSDRLKNLGLDALIGAPQLPAVLGSIKSRRVVHSLLMDQSKVTGLGNIYVSEVCFHAGINPLRPWNDLSEVERKAIGYYIGEVMQDSLEHGGSSISDFVNVDGDKGEYQLYHCVYGREGEACKREGCDGSIKRVEHKKRAVFFCPKCQPLVPESVEVAEVEA